jgi:uroporphyrinogen decarboxylase
MVTPKQRVFERIAGNKVDKIPNLSISSLFSAKYSDIDYDTFCCDYRALVAAQSKTAKDFGLDVLSTISDPYRETYDFGAKVKFFKDDPPVCDISTINTLKNWHRLKAWDPFESNRFLDRLKAVELFKKDFGDEYPILGWIEGPLSQFCNLTTLNLGMSMLNEDEKEIRDIFNFITKQEISCVNSQIQSGADIIGISENNAALLSVDFFEKLILEKEIKIIKAIHEGGAISKLHIGGNINHIFPSMLKSNSDIIDVDHLVNLDEAIELNKGQCSLCGNIESAGIILRGNPKEIKGWVDYCIQHSDNKSIISSGSEVSPQTPIANFLAINERLLEIGSNY